MSPLSHAQDTGNFVRRGNLLIDLDTGKIHIITPENEEQTLEEINNWSTTNEPSDNEAEAEEDQTEEENTNSNSSSNGGNSETKVVAPSQQEKPEETGEINNNETNSPENQITENETEQETITNNTTTAADNSISWLKELEDAHAWMYNNWLTIYDNLNDYRPNDNLTREEAAKIVGKAYEVLGYTQKDDQKDCSFLDITDVDQNLQQYVINSCANGLFKWRNNRFHPTESLTKAQTLAVLIRMFEGKISNQSQDPRRIDYYKKWKAIGITKETNQENIEKTILRYEIALFVYRFKNIVSNDITKNLTIQALEEATKNDSGTSTSSKIDTSIITNNANLITQWISVNNDPEFKEAVFWMYTQWFTQYDTIEEFRPFDLVTKEEWAKFLGSFYKKFVDKEGSTAVPDECYYDDIEQVQEPLRLYVIYTCQQGILNISDGTNFLPQQQLSKADFVAGIVEMFDGSTTRSVSEPRRQSYFDKAVELGVISHTDIINFDRPITRYEIALLLYRFNIRYTLLSNLNNNTLPNQVISMQSTLPIDSSNGLRQWVVSIDVNTILAESFDQWFITLFDTNYKISKKAVDKYFTDNVVWYGDVIDITTNNPSWTISFVVSNGTVINGLIRTDTSQERYFEIMQQEWGNGLYSVIEK